MAANQFGIDLGEAFRDAEAIKSARNRNAMSSMQLDTAKRNEENRPAMEANAQARQNKLSGLRSEAATGNEGAQQQLLAMDPEGAPSFIDAVSKMDDRKIEATKKTVDEIGQMSAYVLQGKTPEEQKRRYSLVRGGVSKDVQSKLPEVFDQGFVELSLKKATTMDQILENPKSVSVGGQDVLYKGGQEIERQNKPVSSSSSSSEGGMKAGDENTMYKQSVELLGGLFDQAGNITNLDPTVRNKIQGITTEATKIFKQGGVTRSEAVTQAAKKYGVDVASMPNDKTVSNAAVDGYSGASMQSSRDNDPLGIRS